MDMHSRNQYLRSIRNEYLLSSKKDKNKLLDEAMKRVGLHRKYIVKKLKLQSDLNKTKQTRRKRTSEYDGQVISILVKLWKIFDYPCGQRLEPLIKDHLDRLRYFDEIKTNENVSLSLKKISSSTIDRKLKHQKEVERLNRKYQHKHYPQLYHDIPIKTDGWNKVKPGEEQIDMVEHCGNSASGEFICSLSVADTACGWWTGRGVMGRGQKRVSEALYHVRLKNPFNWKGIHSDNGTEFINHHLYAYCLNTNLEFSRSRPYHKNDNCFVEQKNSTHIRQIFGYLRYDTYQELKIINGLYDNELYLYKNFFQPVMKLVEKIRIKGRIHRKYDKPKTPYQRLVESNVLDEGTKIQLQTLYGQLNPAELKREIDRKLILLYKAYQEKNNNLKVAIDKRLQPTTTTFLSKSKVNFGKIIKYDLTRF